MKSRYFQSLGLNTSVRLCMIAIGVSAGAAAAGFIQHAFVISLLALVICWRVLVAVLRDYELFSAQVHAVQTGKAEEFDSVHAGPMERIYPLVDNLLRLANRRLSQVESVSQEMGFSAKELASNANEVARHCEKQAEATTSSASAATEISQSIDDVSNRIESARKAMVHGSELCQQGRAALTETQHQVASVSDSVQVTGSSMQALDKQLAGVVSMSQFIQEIAEQTNLLALNAAIEAARAGDHGRGFSVVADEVRSLALRSQESATAITQQVTDVTRSMSEVVQQMEDVVISTQTCKERVEAADHALDEMIASIVAMMGQITGISTASEQQSIATREISQNLEQVAVTAERNAYMAKQNASVAIHLQNITHMEACES